MHLTGRRSLPEARVRLLLEPHVDPGHALHLLTSEALAHAVQKLSGPPGVTPEAAPFSFLCFVRATKKAAGAR